MANQRFEVTHFTTINQFFFGFSNKLINFVGSNAIIHLFHTKLALKIQIYVKRMTYQVLPSLG